MKVKDKHDHWLKQATCFKCAARIHYPDGVWYRRVHDVLLADGCNIRSKQAHRNCDSPLT